MVFALEVVLFWGDRSLKKFVQCYLIVVCAEC